jgi:hypothetical protein
MRYMLTQETNDSVLLLQADIILYLRNISADKQSALTTIKSNVLNFRLEFQNLCLRTLPLLILLDVKGNFGTDLERLVSNNLFDWNIQTI